MSHFDTELKGDPTGVGGGSEAQAWDQFTGRPEPRPCLTETEGLGQYSPVLGKVRSSELLLRITSFINSQRLSRRAEPSRNPLTSTTPTRVGRSHVQYKTFFLIWGLGCEIVA